VTEPGELALYVLAHQDDEYGCIAQMRRDAASARRVVVVFLTDGTMPHVGGDVRTAESRAVLERIGVAPRDVVVVGAPLGIPCLALPGELEQAYQAMLTMVRSRDCTAPVHVTTCAWEGGNPDHDAAHLAAARLARELGVTDFREFALYNGYRRMGPFFRVLSFCDGARAGDDAGPRMSVGQALHDAFLCRHYPSQRTTWLGLFPGALARLLWRRRHAVRRIAVPQKLRRPHAGPLYYERRWRVSYESFSALTATFFADSS
jgi:LmbE family N-acetylglucosaminyl deacetylase